MTIRAKGEHAIYEETCSIYLDGHALYRRRGICTYQYFILCNFGMGFLTIFKYKKGNPIVGLPFFLML